jgi:hypothetical protein
VCEYLERLRPDAERWLHTEDVPKELLLGRRVLLDESLRFDPNISFNKAPRSLALHGIRLPAGCVKWDPMSGKSDQIELMYAPAGVVVDIRGFDAPMPAASRLFLLPDEAKKFAVPFLRACLHHALGLAAGKPREVWQAWLDDFIGTLPRHTFWPELYHAERDTIEPIFTYTVYIKSVGGVLERVYYNRELLIERFGQWVPTTRWAWTKEGIVIDMRGEWARLAFRERRRRADGVWEFNMNSEVEIPLESLRDALNRLSQDISYWPEV